jgi:hypothetical protein
VLDRLHDVIAALGIVDLILAVLLAARVSRGQGLGRFVAILRNPPAPPLLRGFGDFVEILFYCWLLVYAVSLAFPREELLDALSTGVTLTLLAASIVYLAALLLLPRQSR